MIIIQHIDTLPTYGKTTVDLRRFMRHICNDIRKLYHVSFF